MNMSRRILKLTEDFDFDDEELYGDDSNDEFLHYLGDCPFAYGLEISPGSKGSYYQPPEDPSLRNLKCQVLKGKSCYFADDDEDCLRECPIRDIEWEEGENLPEMLCDEISYDYKTKKFYCDKSKKQCIKYPDYNSLLQAIDNPSKYRYDFNMEKRCPIFNNRYY